MKVLHPTFFLLARDSEPVTFINALDDDLERPISGLERRQRLTPEHHLQTGGITPV